VLEEITSHAMCFHLSWFDQSGLGGTVLRPVAMTFRPYGMPAKTPQPTEPLVTLYAFARF
jgi:hypothetical protein